MDHEDRMYSSQSSINSFHLVSTNQQQSKKYFPHRPNYFQFEGSQHGKGNGSKRKQNYGPRDYRKMTNYNPLEGTSMNAMQHRINWGYFEDVPNRMRPSKNYNPNNRQSSNGSNIKNSIDLSRSQRPPSQQEMLIRGLKNNKRNPYQPQHVTREQPSCSQSTADDFYYHPIPVYPQQFEFSESEQNQKYQCPICNLKFSVRISNNNYLGKVPLVLECCHTICQECIYKYLKTGKIKCPICQKYTIVKQKSPIHQTDLIHLFHPNYYLLGWLVYHNNYGISSVYENRVKSVPFVTHRKQSTTSVKTQSTSNSQSETSPIDMTENVPDHRLCITLEICKEHRSELEFFCIDCNQYGCCYDILQTHYHHERLNLCDLDKTEMEEFNLLQNNAKMVLKEIIKTQKKLQTWASGDNSALEQEICQYFMDYHSKLTAIEEELLQDTKYYKIKNPDLKAIQLDLSKQAAELQTLLSIKKERDKKYNMRAGLEKLRDLKNIPRFLAGQNHLKADLKFVADPVDPVSDDLKKTFCIEMTGSVRLFLDSKKSDLCLLQDNSSSNDLDEETLSSASVPIETESESDTSLQYLDLNKSLPKIATSHERSKTKLDIAQVELQHIDSIDSFYVQLKNNQAKFDQLNNEMFHYIKMDASGVIGDVKQNKHYLVLYRTDNEEDVQWCRGKLIEINEKDDKYEVFFIDYGRTQKVSRDRIKEIPEFLLRHKPFAVHCSLYNPMNVEWNANAHHTFSRILNGNEVCMIVKSNDDPAEVDLLISGSNQTVTSVIDILIYCNKSVKARVPPVHTARTLQLIQSSDLKIFPNSQAFQLKQTEKVVIAHVINPNSIVIHKVSDQDAFNKMNKDIKKAFKEVKGCLPVEGSFVLVHYEYASNLYHRGFVKNVDFENDQVQVLLVDWGLNAIVRTSNIKPIQERFIKLESQAILVKLAHIIPSNKQKIWQPSAIDYLQSLRTSGKTFKIIVNSIKPEIEVALFDTSKKDEICINTEMVQYGFAESTGNISKELYWIKSRGEQVQLSENNGLLESFLKQINDKIINETNEDTELPYKKIRKIQIVKVETPDCIWVKFSDANKLEKAMCRDLMTHYTRLKVSDKTTFELNDVCVVNVGDGYARGKITKVDEDRCTLFLYDRVEEIVVPKQEIFEVDDYFKKYFIFAVRCRLANISAAGGDSGKWSIASTETLQEIFSLYKEIYAVELKNEVTGTEQKKTMPLLMWYCLKIPGSAVEPDRIKYVSINDILVSLGLAFKISKPDDDANKEVDSKEKLTEEPAETDSNANEEQLDDESVNQLKPSSTTPAEGIKLIEKDTHNQSEEKCDEEAEIDEMQTKKQVIDIDDWLPPMPFNDTVFDAMVTCAETGGHLYVRHEKWEEPYKVMETNMNNYFDLNPPSINQCEWEPDQLCTIQFEKKWYRGKIVKISDHKITVLMVDFGSDHVIDGQFIFKEILYPEIPIFTSKVKLYNIYSRSLTWTSEDYDQFHNLLTDWCRIVIKSPKHVTLPLVEVYNDSSASVNEELVKFCPNLVRDPGILASSCPEDSNDEGEFPEPSVKSDNLHVDEMDVNMLDHDMYKNLVLTSLPLPKKLVNGEKVPLEIGGFIDYDKVAFKDSTCSSSEDYYDLVVDIQESITKLPPLNRYEVGILCLAPYSADGVYYRARISNVQGAALGFIEVFFVDYGNSEIVACDKLLQIDSDFLNLPQQTWEATLNYTVKQEREAVSILKFLNLLDENNVLIKLVKEDPLTVDLFNEYGSLCYESLIKSGSLIVPHDANKQEVQPTDNVNLDE